MHIIVPEEKKKLKRIFRPYLEGTHLREDAPQEVVDAYDEYYKWFEKELGIEQ